MDKVQDHGGKAGPGHRGGVLTPYIPKTKAAARKALGPDTVDIWTDNARAHTAAAARAAFARHFKFWPTACAGT